MKLAETRPASSSSPFVARLEVAHTAWTRAKPRVVSEARDEAEELAIAAVERAHAAGYPPEECVERGRAVVDGYDWANAKRHGRLR